MVIRKCSREGWGISLQGYGRKPAVPKGCGELGAAELEAIQRVLQDTPASVNEEESNERPH